MCNRVFQCSRITFISYLDRIGIIASCMSSAIRVCNIRQLLINQMILTEPVKQNLWLQNMRQPKKQKSITDHVTVEQSILDYCNLKSNVLSPSTIREYLRMQRNNYDIIKEVILKDISNDLIQKWVNLFSANHSPKSVKNAYEMIKIWRLLFILPHLELYGVLRYVH